MALYTINKNGTKYRLYGFYEKRSGSGTPMIKLSLQIVKKGFQDVGLIRFDLFKKAVSLLKENDIQTHSDFAKIVKDNIK